MLNRLVSQVRRTTSYQTCSEAVCTTSIPVVCQIGATNIKQVATQPRTHSNFETNQGSNNLNT